MISFYLFLVTNASLALPTFLPTFTVVSRGRTNAALHPLTKLGGGAGIELQSLQCQPRVVTTWRLWSTRVGDGLIRVIRIHVILRRCHRSCDSSLFLKYCHRYCDSSLVLKMRVATLQCYFEFATFRTSMHYLETSVTIVITTTSRCRLTLCDSSVLTTYTDWFFGQKFSFPIGKSSFDIIRIGEQIII